MGVLAHDLSCAHLTPSHIGYFNQIVPGSSRRKPSDLSFYQAQAFSIPKFLTAIKQQLQSQADPKQGFCPAPPQLSMAQSIRGLPGFCMAS